MYRRLGVADYQKGGGVEGEEVLVIAEGKHNDRDDVNGRDPR